ncbi:MAG: hypothetical protein J6R32_06320 [Bacteroidales bacterium]|nr:hypothetical protein [Bacteroidales bacterium]
MELKERNIILQFTGENGEKTIDGLNVRFSVRQVCYAFGSQAQISIYNLSMQDVNYLTLFSPFFSSKKRNTVKISAGYDNNIVPIFEGDVWQALPTKNGADIVLNIKAVKGLFGGKKITSKVIKNKAKRIPLHDVCQKVAGWLDLPLNFLAKTQKTLDTFVMTGNVTEAIKKINSVGDVVAFVEDNQLKVIDAKNPQGTGTRLVSEDTGMIGIPAIDHFGATVKIFMDNTVKLGDKIQLKSKLIPSANGDYYVYCIQHDGALREQQFYSTLKCRRGGMI